MPDVQPSLDHLTFLDDKQPEMVDLVLQLCNINSGTPNVDGVKKVAECLAGHYRELSDDIHTHQLPDMQTVDDAGNIQDTPLGPLIHVVKNPKVRPRLILCIHTDTVYDTQHPFQECQWLDDKKTLNGPGVADAKGGQVVMLYALKALQQSPFADRLGWEVIMNPDEEIGSPGSTDFMQERAREADFGLLFEPSLPDGTLVSWRKGSGNFDFVFRGVAAHSGRDFDKGRNAVAAMSRMLVEIDDWNTDPQVTYNVAKVSGGSAPNIVPDVAVGRVNVRVKTRSQLVDVYEKFEEVVQRYNQMDGITVTQHGKFRSTPKTIDEGTETLQSVIEAAGNDLGIPVSWRGTGGASDGNKMAAAGLANIDTMGPQGGSIHSSDEFLLVDSLVPRARLAALTMMKLAASFKLPQE